MTGCTVSQGSRKLAASVPVRFVHNDRFGAQEAIVSDHFDTLLSQRPDILRSFAENGDLCWTVQTWCRLRDAGIGGIEIATGPAEGRINIAKSKTLSRTGSETGLFQVSIQADYPRVLWAQFHIQQNADLLCDDGALQYLWPQAGIIPREPTCTAGFCKGHMYRRTRADSDSGVEYSSDEGAAMSDDSVSSDGSGEWRRRRRPARTARMARPARTDAVRAMLRGSRTAIHPVDNLDASTASSTREAEPHSGKTEAKSGVKSEVRSDAQLDDIKTHVWRTAGDMFQQLIEKQDAMAAALEQKHEAILDLVKQQDAITVTLQQEIARIAEQQAEINIALEADVRSLGGQATEQATEQATAQAAAQAAMLDAIKRVDETLRGMKRDSLVIAATIDAASQRTLPVQPLYNDPLDAAPTFSASGRVTGAFELDGAQWLVVSYRGRAMYAKA